VANFQKLIDEAMNAVAGVAGVYVTYYRGDDYTVIRATPGQTDFQMDTGDGAVVEFRSRDFFISVCDLKLNDEAITPKRGDQIVERDGNQNIVFEVSDPSGSDQPWRYSDTGRTHFRIHTKQRNQGAR
jgi:hypothetical protein